MQQKLNNEFKLCITEVFGTRSHSSAIRKLKIPQIEMKPRSKFCGNYVAVKPLSIMSESTD